MRIETASILRLIRPRSLAVVMIFLAAAIVADARDREAYAEDPIAHKAKRFREN